MKDAKGTGLSPMQEFKEVLYLDVGVSPAHLDVLFNSIGCANSGFMDYAEWLRFVAATPMPAAADFRKFYRATALDPAASAPAAQASYVPSTAPADLLAEEAAHKQSFNAGEQQAAVRDEHV